MQAFKRILISAILAGAMVLLGPSANGGRIGGPASETATVLPYASAFVDIPFAVAEPAVLNLVGNGRTDLDLIVTDGDGRVWIGTGFGDRKAVTINVFRAGMFRVEVKNLGPMPNTCTLSTN